MSHQWNYLFDYAAEFLHVACLYILFHYITDLCQITVIVYPSYFCCWENCATETVLWLAVYLHNIFAVLSHIDIIDAEFILSMRDKYVIGDYAQSSRPPRERVDHRDQHMMVQD